jgi:hypothetical protein
VRKLRAKLAERDGLRPAALAVSGVGPAVDDGVFRKSGEGVSVRRKR